MLCLAEMAELIMKEQHKRVTVLELLREKVQDLEAEMVAATLADLYSLVASLACLFELKPMNVISSLIGFCVFTDNRGSPGSKDRGYEAIRSQHGRTTCDEK